MKKHVASLILLAGLVSTLAKAADGVSVWGEEAREVYNTLITAGATRTQIPEGPTVIIDKLDCLQTGTGTALTTFCKFQGDPKLSQAEGPIAARMLKALQGIGVKTKTVDAKTITVGVSNMECGVLNYPPQESLAGDVHASEMPSCYYVDNN